MKTFRGWSLAIVSTYTGISSVSSIWRLGVELTVLGNGGSIASSCSICPTSEAGSLASTVLAFILGAAICFFSGKQARVDLRISSARNNK